MEEDTINREKIHELVGVFYQQAYRTFYVNSRDGKNICRPYGVFVSLGITTSLLNLSQIKDVIIGSGEYNAELAEIMSENRGDVFINTLLDNEEIKQYQLDRTKYTNLLDEKQSRARLDELTSMITPESDLSVLKNISPKIQKLTYLINRLSESNSWDNHLIQEDGDTLKIFHLNVNYKKIDNLEYRIGIFVYEKNKE